MHKNSLKRDSFVTLMEKIFDEIPIPVILVDDEMRVQMINQIFAKYLNYEREDMIGEIVTDLDKYTRWPQVFKSKKGEIAWQHKFQNNRTATVHRIPVLDDNNNIKYGFGMVLIQTMDEYQFLIDENKLLEEKLVFYQNQFKNINESLYSFENIIGDSKALNEVKTLAKKAARTNSNVLLQGESGTGKELFAHSIHNASTRAAEPFIKVNCAAIPRELLESELFGYDEGAFTGSKKGGKPGKFELSNNGTIFLDEIGDMQLEMQVKLLRVIQEREVERLGSNKTRKINVKIICATNKNLKEMVKEGLFREDLYYRLDVVSIRIPSLRERKEDIRTLSENIFKKLSERMNKKINSIEPEVISCFTEYDWPGNIRELENVIERVLNFCEKDNIELEDIPINIRNNSKRSLPSLQEAVMDIEKEMIKKAVLMCNNNKLEAAKLLKISKTSLYDKINKYKI